MAKDDKKRSADNANVREFDDPEIVEARETNQPYPEGEYVIKSPYGQSQVDIGNMQVVEGGTVTPGGMVVGGGARGDDGNTGSSRS